MLYLRNNSSTIFKLTSNTPKKPRLYSRLSDSLCLLTVVFTVNNQLRSTRSDLKRK